MEERGVRREQEVKEGKGDSEDGEARNRMEGRGRGGKLREEGREAMKERGRREKRGGGRKEEKGEKRREEEGRGKSEDGEASSWMEVRGRGGEEEVSG